MKRFKLFIYNLFFSPHRYSRRSTSWRNAFGLMPFELLLYRVMAFINGNYIEGDYLEFGTYKGRNLASAHHIAHLSGLKNMRFYAFDSFEGLPEIQGVDREGFCNFKKGDFSCSKEEFLKILKKRKVDLNKVQLIPGWFDQILNDETKRSLPIKKAAVIWIDCDLYESTVPVLNFITDYIQNGTIIIFDDWFAFRGHPNRGEQLAFREWLAKNPQITASEFRRFDWNDNSFILHHD